MSAAAAVADSTMAANPNSVNNVNKANNVNRVDNSMTVEANVNPPCEAVIFDMDGTMIDSEGFWHQAFIECFALVGIHLSFEDMEETTGIRTKDVIRYRYNQKPWNEKELGITQKQLVDMALKRVIDLTKTQGKAMKGLQNAINFVLNLKRNNPLYKDLKLAVCSQSAMVLIKAVCEERLASVFNGCFDLYMSAEQLDYGKPHPKCYLQCASKLGVDPRKCLVFEDSMTGTLAAKAAQMKVVSIPLTWPNYSKRYFIADKIIGSLDEVNSDLWDQIWCLGDYSNEKPTHDKLTSEEVLDHDILFEKGHLHHGWEKMYHGLVNFDAKSLLLFMLAVLSLWIVFM